MSTTRRLGVAAALVDGSIVPGDVEVDAGSGDVVAVGIAPAGRSGLAVPGFVDVQVNGFAGVAFTDPDVDLDGYRSASTAMARTGVTSFVLTIPTVAPGTYAALLPRSAEACRTDLGGARAIGVHLEGPFLNPQRRGAHREEWIQPPSISSADAMLDVAPVALMTLAPEMTAGDGGVELIGHLRRRGVTVSLGHTDADAAQANAGYDAGATAITHLWNAHRPITSRDPGVGAVALTRREVWVCAIADLAHVSAESLALSVAAAGDRFVVVTDAVAPAGAPDAPLPALRLADGTLAGSTTPLDQGIRNLVAIGVPLVEAVAAATRRPAALIGRPDLGRLVPGGRADIVVLDDDLLVHQVLVDGHLTG
jgi:N-acetylglucosamine-6-phosphate deacetylase